MQHQTSSVKRLWALRKIRSMNLKGGPARATIDRICEILERGEVQDVRRNENRYGNLERRKGMVAGASQD
jgi:hypothetical protein